MKRLIIAVLLLPVSLLAQTFTTPIRVNQDKSLRADMAPMMKLDRQGNIYIAWISGVDNNGNGPISMAVSNDGGTTFSTQSIVCADANCNANFQRTAQFVIDTKGTIHLAWMGNRVNNQSDIWYVRSNDLGKSWTQPRSVCDADDSSKYAQDFPSIACDSSDNLYVSFLDSREDQRKTSTTPHLYFTRSTDGGLSWSVNKKADIFSGGIGGTCQCCTENMESTPDGQVYIVFRSNINNLRDIWLTRSYDKGMTFQPALKIVTGDWNIDACPVTGPKIALDDTTGAHIVWRDARDNTGGAIHLYYAFVPKGSIQTPMNTSFDAAGAQEANYPDIALYGKFHALAYETFNYGMRYILTSDAFTLVNNRPLTVNANSHKSFATVLFASDGTRYLSWQDDMNDPGDIYFCKETSALPGVTDSVPGSVVLVSPLSDAVVPVPVTLVWEKTAGALSYHVQVYPKMDSQPPIIPVYDSTGINTTSIVIQNLKAMPELWRYEWFVSAINSEGEGPKSSRQFLTAKASVAQTTINSFRIYPNPVSAENPAFTIERSGTGLASVKIVDLLGREVATTSIEAGSLSKIIILPNLPVGTYYCILHEGENVSESMIIVK